MNKQTLAKLSVANWLLVFVSAFAALALFFSTASFTEDSPKFRKQIETATTFSDLRAVANGWMATADQTAQDATCMLLIAAIVLASTAGFGIYSIATLRRLRG